MFKSITFDRHKLNTGDKIWLVALVGWLLVMIATPITDWIGWSVFPLMATIGVLAHATATFTALLQNWSWQRIGGVLLVIGGMAWLAEFIGVQTGLPFGEYHYTDHLQPQFQHVPLIIPLAWFMMLPPAWAMVDQIFDDQPSSPIRRKITFAAMSALAFTAWDLYLDPQMVSRDLWQWHQPGAYFGIPLLNFFGWWLTSFVITLLIRPDKLPRFKLIVIYTLTWWFQAVGLGIFWGQPAPALVGCVAMGVFVTTGWRRWSFSGQ